MTGADERFVVRGTYLLCAAAAALLVTITVITGYVEGWGVAGPRFGVFVGWCAFLAVGAVAIRSGKRLLGLAALAGALGWDAFWALSSDAMDEMILVQALWDRETIVFGGALFAGTFLWRLRER